MGHNYQLVVDLKVQVFRLDNVNIINHQPVAASFPCCTLLHNCTMSVTTLIKHFRHKQVHLHRLPTDPPHC